MKSEIPSQIIIDTPKTSRGVIVTPEVQQALPEVEDAFVKVDEAFLKDPEAYLCRLRESFFTFKVQGRPELTASLLYDDQSKKDEILVILAPCSDGPPKSSAEEIYSYIKAENSGFLAKKKAQPNSWNQTTKSGVIFDLLGAIGNGMPVLTIYSPIPVRAYGKDERQKFEYGDFTPAAAVVQAAIAAAQARLHGTRSETQIDKVNLHGASLGASNSVGAGARLMEEGNFVVPSLTAQELIMGPDSLADVAKRFSPLGARVGEASTLELPAWFLPKIYEPKIRQSIDRYGNEAEMLARMARAAKPTYLRALAQPGETMYAIENLLDKNVAVLVALAENSGLTHQTKNHLPNAGEKVITIKAEKGQYADHLVDEHVALTGLIAALNIKNRSN